MARPVQRKAGFASSFSLPAAVIVSSGEFRLIQRTTNEYPPHPQIGLIHLLAYPVLFWLANLLFVREATAGLSAAEVVVAVNGGSLNSRTLANHYARLRSIPSVNIVVLDEIPDREQITVQEFRDRILLPLFKEIEQRNLAGHVQCIAYSADFPTAIDISQDLTKLKDLHTVFTKVASINGLTYFYDLTLKSDPTYITPEANFYARRVMGAYFTNPGGKETEELWGDINLQANEQDFDKASQSVDQLTEKLPFQFPLKYLSAAYAAKANQSDKALKRLDEAISSGWTSGGYLASDARFDGLRENDEFQSLAVLLDQDSGKWQPTIAFNSRSAWAANGVDFPFDSKKNNLGLKYILSTVLGVTRGLGNTLEEAINSLQRSKEADFTHPQGGFYFSSSLDVRTKTRQPNFNLAVDELKALGFEAEVVYQSLPTNRSSVLGAQIGVANFDWKNSASMLVPGAIVENLTSMGGVITPPNSQTPLTHLIAAGAAGSSGTVTEPYSVQFKFPTPLLYVHYAQGLSLAEAFYQSVTGPYQLLIVGDPLCQPFSIAPNKAIDITPRVVTPNGSIHFQPDLSGPSYVEWLSLKMPPSQRKVQLRPAKIAVQIDGSVPLGGNIQPTINVKMERQTLGYHEVQVTLAGDDPLKQRFLQVVPVWIGPLGVVKMALEGPNSAELKKSIADESLTVIITAPAGCKEISVFHHHEQVASTTPSGTTTPITIEPAKLGLGPVRLQARVTQADGAIVASQPLWVELVP